MSRFSGKCDLYDWLRDKSLDEIKEIHIFTYDSDIPLKINCIQDIIPYYPYIVLSAVINNVVGTSVIHLSKESYVNEHEKEMLNFHLKYLKREYTKCKRKKIEFIPEDALKNIVCIASINKPIVSILAERVKIFGNKATINDLHLPSQKWYRINMIEEMLRNNMNPEEYGYSEWMVKNE